MPKKQAGFGLLQKLFDAFQSTSSITPDRANEIFRRLVDPMGFSLDVEANGGRLSLPIILKHLPEAYRDGGLAADLEGFLELLAFYRFCCTRYHWKFLGEETAVVLSDEAALNIPPTNPTPTGTTEFEADSLIGQVSIKCGGDAAAWQTLRDQYEKLGSWRAVLKWLGIKKLKLNYLTGPIMAQLKKKAVAGSSAMTHKANPIADEGTRTKRKYVRRVSTKKAAKKRAKKAVRGSSGTSARQTLDDFCSEKLKSKTKPAIKDLYERLGSWDAVGKFFRAKGVDITNANLYYIYNH